MKTTRVFALPAAVALAAMMLLGGCNQKPGAAPSSQPEGTSQPAGGAESPSQGAQQAPAAAPQPATMAEAVVVGGATIFPRGTSVEGSVIDAQPMGHFKGGARLAIRLERVGSGAASYPVATSTVERTLKGKGKRSAVLIGGGAGLGALVGGLAGGGKGAAIGAAAGGGAGTAGAAATGNKQIVLPAGTALTFRLERAVRVTP
jgi:hypothetical protein